MHICNLRKKLGKNGDLIRTVRGVGYLCRSGHEGRRAHDMRSIFCQGLALVARHVRPVAGRLLGDFADSRTPRAARGRPFHRMIDMVQDDALGAYEEGGRRLSAHLQRVSSYLPGEHLLDRFARTRPSNGADRSDLLRRGPRCPRVAPAVQRLLRPCRPHASQQVISIHLDLQTVVRAAEYPAVLWCDRSGHRRHGRDPGRASGRPAAQPASGGRPVRPRRAVDARPFEAQG